MTTTIIAKLEKLIGSARDGALLRYSLGSEWLKAGDPARAAEHLRAAIERDAQYSAAWKALGSLQLEGRTGADPWSWCPGRRSAGSGLACWTR